MAREFDSTKPEYARVGSAVVTAAPLTLAVWFLVYSPNLNSSFGAPSATFLALGDHSGSDNNCFLVGWNGVFGSTSVIQAQTNASGSSDLSKAPCPQLAPRRWYHAAAVFSSPTSRIAYFNGIAGPTNSTSLTPALINDTDLGMVDLGVVSGPYQTMSGQLVYPALWNAALNPNDIMMLSQGIDPVYVRRDALVSSWDDFGRDRVGTTHLTLTGGRVIPNRESRQYAFHAQSLYGPKKLLHY